VLSARIWLFLHVLLFAYWLGADLGVLVLARAARRSTLSFAERVLALNAAGAIGLAPRICLALMLPSGLQLVHASYAPVSRSVLVLAWLVGIAWTALLVVASLRPQGRLAPLASRIHLGLQLALCVLLGALGVSALLGSGPLPGGWIAAKVVLFGAACALGAGIDYAFRPALPAFARLVKEGSRPEIEAPIAAGIDSATRLVLVLYGVLIVCAALGVGKPF
jgi:hypothetical protein